MTDALAFDPVAVLWSAPPAERTGRPLLILLHGYGADEHDLFALAPHLPTEFVVVAVRAPLTPPWPAPGFSWYPLDGPGAHRPDAITAAARAFVEWAQAAAGGAVVGLLGFSQGGAVALQSLRLRPDLFDFAVNLSGYVTPGALDGDDALAARKPPVFWGRGTRDDVIPSALVEHTVQWLPAHVELSGRVYTGLTHSVSQEELKDVRTFLDKRLAEGAVQPDADPQDQPGTND